jgi:hypothetical protein
MAVATYLHKNTATGKYDARFEWDGVAVYPIPPGHTRELETGANQAQAAADLAAQFSAALVDANLAQRDLARIFLLNDPRPEMKALRALALVVLDEINLVRQNPTAVLAARTAPQLLNAMVTKITDGSAD